MICSLASYIDPLPLSYLLCCVLLTSKPKSGEGEEGLASQTRMICLTVDSGYVLSLTAVMHHVHAWQY